MRVSNVSYTPKNGKPDPASTKMHDWRETGLFKDLSARDPAFARDVSDPNLSQSELGKKLLYYVSSHAEVSTGQFQATKYIENDRNPNKFLDANTKRLATLPHHSVESQPTLLDRAVAEFMKLGDLHAKTEALTDIIDSVPVYPADSERTKVLLPCIGKVMQDLGISGHLWEHLMNKLPTALRKKQGDDANLENEHDRHAENARRQVHRGDVLSKMVKLGVNNKDAWDALLKVSPEDVHIAGTQAVFSDRTDSLAELTLCCIKAACKNNFKKPNEGPDPAEIARHLIDASSQMVPMEIGDGVVVLRRGESGDKSSPSHFTLPRAPRLNHAFREKILKEAGADVVKLLVAAPRGITKEALNFLLGNFSRVMYWPPYTGEGDADPQRASVFVQVLVELAASPTASDEDWKIAMEFGRGLPPPDKVLVRKLIAGSSSAIKGDKNIERIHDALVDHPALYRAALQRVADLRLRIEKFAAQLATLQTTTVLIQKGNAWLAQTTANPADVVRLANDIELHAQDFEKLVEAEMEELIAGPKISAQQSEERARNRALESKERARNRALESEERATNLPLEVESRSKRTFARYALGKTVEQFVESEWEQHRTSMGVIAARQAVKLREYMENTANQLAAALERADTDAEKIITLASGVRKRAAAVVEAVMRKP